RQVVEIELGGSRELLVDDLVAEVDALVADVDAGPGDELLHLALRLAAEAAEELFVRVGGSGHGSVLRDHAVDDSVIGRFVRGHEEIPLRVAGDLLQRLAGLVGDDLVEALSQVDDLARMYLDIGRLALESRADLVDQE